MRILTGLILMFSAQLWACLDPQIAKTTVYYLPDAQKICGSYGIQCPKFLTEINMQGSGRLSPREILRSNGQIEKIESCNTTIGAARECLIPYISIAADPVYYRKGDIVYIPALRKKKVKLSNTKILNHPGYFIVQDVGGDIVGESRFDFFSIDADLHHPNNSFGYKAKAESRLYSLTTCEDYKKFSLVLPGSDDYIIARNAIDRFVQKLETP
jgi:3D (Asp-Asp-Asp) domain-containing protein